MVEVKRSGATIQCKEKEADSFIRHGWTLVTEAPAVTIEEEPVKEEYTEEMLSKDNMQYNEVKKLAKDLDLDNSGTRDEIVARIVGVEIIKETEEV